VGGNRNSSRRQFSLFWRLWNWMTGGCWKGNGSQYLSILEVPERHKLCEPKPKPWSRRRTLTRFLLFTESKC
jgi:hypothetical protein